MYEYKSEPLASKKVFVFRLFKSILMSFVLIGILLFIGMICYLGFIPELSWVDCFLEASMIMGGMGAVQDLRYVSNDAKIFAGIYAIFSGMIFLTGFSVIIAPFIHRFLHKFHIGEDKKSGHAR